MQAEYLVKAIANDDEVQNIPNPGWGGLRVCLWNRRAFGFRFQARNMALVLADSMVLPLEVIGWIPARGCLLSTSRMILVTGPTVPVSPPLASMINIINETQDRAHYYH